MKSLFSKIIKRKSKTQPSSQEEHLYDSTVEEFDDYEDELINMLIGMSKLVSIAQKNEQTMGEYYTLRHVNEMLCQQRVDIKQLAQWMINKSSAGMTWIEAQEKCRKGKGGGMGNQHNHPPGRSPAGVMRGFYCNYSNGLLYQYYPVRCLLWKILIGYLPQFKNKWVSISEANLIKYQQYLRGFIVDINNKKSVNLIKGDKDKKIQSKTMTQSNQVEIQSKDHPLNRQKQSKWKNYFEDSELWRLLQKDTSRTRPSALFFSTTYTPQFTLSPSELSLSKNPPSSQLYSDCLTRILFIYLKNHPQCTYSQGMNELASIILYSFVKGNSQYGRRVGESDAYFCFEVMIYLSGGDHAFTNGEGMGNKLQDLLKRVDLRLYQALSQSSFNSLHSLKLISIRWFSSMFLAQFNLDSCLVLYDTFLAVASLHSLFSTFTQPSSIFPHKLSLSDWQVYLGLAVIYLHRSQLGQGVDPMIVFKDGIGTVEAITQKALGLYKMYHGVIK